MDNQRNVIIAILLSAVVLFGWQYAMEIFYPAPPQTEQSASVAANNSSPEDAAANAGNMSKSGNASLDTQGDGDKVMPRKEALATGPRIPIAAPRVKGSINLTGARLDDLTLIDYEESIEKDSPPVHLFSPANTKDQYFAQFGWVGQNIETPNSKTLWTAEGETLSAGKPLLLHWTNSNGQRFEITYSIDENYLITAEQKFINTSDAPVTIRSIGLINRTKANADPSTYILRNGSMGVFEGAADFDNDYDEILERGAQGISFTQDVSWIGFSDHYWLSALVPQNSKKAGNDVTGFFRSMGGDIFQSELQYQNNIVNAGQEYSQKSLLFAGAKENDLLDAYSAQNDITLLDRAVDWGWFIWIEKPIFLLLDKLYDLVGNFGLAIMCLVVLIRLILFPIAQKQFKSMAAMRAIQPKMKKLQERYKDDRQKMQQEVMALYKKEKVNPLAGCLPIFLQIPIFFALYKVLMLSIEMRHKPFVLWIQDLSAPDPLTPVNLFGLIPFDPPGFLAIGVLPIIVGFTMYLQFKLNPQQMDPVQQQVFSFMPWIMMFIMAPFAAGLQLYWATNNVLTIAQQKWLYSKNPQLREMMAQEAEEKRKAKELEAQAAND